MKIRWTSVATGCLMVFVLFAFNPEPAKNQPRSSPDDLFNLALTYYIDAETDEAYSLLKQLSAEYQKQERWEELIRVLGYKGMIKLNRRNFNDSREIVARMDKVAEDYLGRQHLMYSLIYTLKAYLAKEEMNFDQSLYWAEKSVNNLKTGDATQSVTVKSFTALGHVHYSRGDYASAIESYQKGLNATDLIHRKRERYYSKVLLKNNIGIAYRKIGEPSAALRYYEKSRRYLEKLYHTEHPELGKYHNNMGSVFYENGDVGRAAEYFIRAAHIFENNYGKSHQMVAAAYNNAGISFLDLERLDEAVHYLTLAQEIKINQLGPNHPDTAVGHANLASLFTNQEDFMSALNSYNLSLSIRKKNIGDSHPDLIQPYLDRGKLLLRMGEPYKALSDFTNVVLIGREFYDFFHPDLAEVLIQIGRVFRDVEEPVTALYSYQQAIIRLTDEYFDTDDIHVNPGRDNLSSHPMLLLEALSAKADLMYESYLFNKDIEFLETAYRTYQLSLDVIEDQQLKFMNEVSKLNLIGTNTSIYEGAIQSAYDLYGITQDKMYVEGAFNFIERSKTRIGSELMRESRARELAGVPVEVLKFEREINSEITFLNHQLTLELKKEEQNDYLIKSLRDSLFTSHRVLNEWTKDLEAGYPAYFRIKHNLDIAELSWFQEEILEEGQMAMNYYLGDAYSFVMVISRNQASLHQLELNGELPDDIEKLMKMLSEENYAGYRQISSSLYEKLITPVEDRIQNYTDLLIIPDHLLHYLPFELLLSDYSSEMREPHEWDYLVRDYQIHYAPSFEVYYTMHKENDFNSNRLLAFAPYIDNLSLQQSEKTDNVSDNDLDRSAPLPISKYEIEEIARIFQKSSGFLDRLLKRRKVTLLKNEEATLDNLNRMDLSDFGYLHFATHAVINEKIPALSGIQLADNGSGSQMLYLHDIRNMEFNADLIVLSACETGLGSFVRGEGMMGFARAFIYSGAPNLVVSLWQVKERPTSELMVRFYREMMNGARKNEALRSAKLSMIEKPETAFPLNWASFILIGR